MIAMTTIGHHLPDIMMTVAPLTEIIITGAEAPLMVDGLPIGESCSVILDFQICPSGKAKLKKGNK